PFSIYYVLTLPLIQSSVSLFYFLLFSAFFLYIYCFFFFFVILLFFVFFFSYVFFFFFFFFFFSSRRRHTRSLRDWSSDVCSSDLGLDDGARRRYSIAATLHLDRVEIGPVRQVVIRIALARHEIARFEVDKFVGAGADRLQVRRRVARGAAFVIFEQMLRDDHATLA